MPAAVLVGGPAAGAPVSTTAATVSDADCVAGAVALQAGARSRERDPADLSAAQVRRMEAHTRRLTDRRPQLTRWAAGRRGDVVVNVAVHVIRPRAQAVEVGPKRARRAVQILSDAFAGRESRRAVESSFRFRMTSFDSTVNSKWYVADVSKRRQRPAVRRMKRTLHVGGPRTLNVYLSRPSEVLGWATFPQSLRHFPRLDGVVVHIGSLAGGDIEGYNQGHTLTHEVGHWLGLYHTFQDGCSRLNDRVSDTAPEASPNFDCPRRRDTCVRDDLQDPIHNFMDYSKDRCLHTFSRGQDERMLLHWLAYRDRR